MGMYASYWRLEPMKEPESKRAVAFILANFQLVSLLSYMQKHEHLEYVVYIAGKQTLRNAADTWQLAEKAEVVWINGVYKWFRWVPKVTPGITYRLRAILTILTKEVGRSCHTLLHGSLSKYNWWLARALSPSQVILLDDGISTIRIAQERMQGAYAYWRNGVHAYTFFDQETFGPHDQIEVATSSTLNEGYESGTTYDLFLGSQIYQYGERAMEEYDAVIRKICAGASELRYLPHPRERKDFVQRIARLHDKVMVVENTAAFEAMLTEGVLQPSKIYSVLSTALFSARLMGFDHDRVIMVRIPALEKAERYTYDRAGAYLRQIAA